MSWYPVSVSEFFDLVFFVCCIGFGLYLYFNWQELQFCCYDISFVDCLAVFLSFIQIDLYFYDMLCSLKKHIETDKNQNTRTEEINKLGVEKLTEFRGSQCWPETWRQASTLTNNNLSLELITYNNLSTTIFPSF